MKKKVYEKPMLVSEEFVVQQYVTVCDPGKWEPNPGAIIKPSFHGYPDLNGNGILDENEKSTEWTSDNSWKGPGLPNSTPMYAWDRDTGERFIIWPTKKEHGVGYGETYIDKNIS